MLPKTTAFVRGGKRAAELTKVESEERKKNSGNKLYNNRFRVSKVGETGGILILDAKLEDIIQVYEHNLPGSDGKWQTYELCFKGSGNMSPVCPICKAYPTHKAYRAIILTVLDLRPWTDKNGNTVKYTRKLLAIKANSIPDFVQHLEFAEKERGTTRGVYMKLLRGGDKEPAHGKPTLLDNGRMFKQISEKTILEKYGHDEIKAQDGTVIYKKNALIEVGDYEKLFSYKSEAYYREHYGMSPLSGSASDIADEWGEGSDVLEDTTPVSATDDELDDSFEPVEEAPKELPTNRSKSGTVVTSRKVSKPVLDDSEFEAE